MSELQQAFKPVGPCATEEKKRTFFHGIQSVMQADDGLQAIDPLAKVTPATSKYDLFDARGFLKHFAQLSGQCKEFLHLLLPGRRSCSHCIEGQAPFLPGGKTDSLPHLQ